MRSLDGPVGGGDPDGTTLGDTLEDEGALDADEASTMAGLKEDMAKLLERLPAREAAVMRMRYGLDGESYTLDDIGRQLKVGRGRLHRGLFAACRERMAAAVACACCCTCSARRMPAACRLHKPPAADTRPPLPPPLPPAQVTRERVRQIEAKALRALRSNMGTMEASITEYGEGSFDKKGLAARTSSGTKKT